MFLSAFPFKRNRMSRPFATFEDLARLTFIVYHNKYFKGIDGRLMDAGLEVWVRMFSIK